MTGSDFITSYRIAVQQLLAARDTLKVYREYAGALNIVAGLTDADFAGGNADLSPAMITAAFTTMDNLERLLTDFTQTPPVATEALIALLKFRRGSAGPIVP